MLQRSLESQKYFLSYWQYALNVYAACYIKINIFKLDAHVQVLIKPHSYNITPETIAMFTMCPQLYADMLSKDSPS